MSLPLPGVSMMRTTRTPTPSYVGKHKQKATRVASIIVLDNNSQFNSWGRIFPSPPNLIRAFLPLESTCRQSIEILHTSSIQYLLWFSACRLLRLPFFPTFFSSPNLRPHGWKTYPARTSSQCEWKPYPACTSSQSNLTSPSST